jgi:hypothetical protein
MDCHTGRAASDWVKLIGHLVLHEIHLPPSGEWEVETCGWRFLQLNSGDGYWLGESAQMRVGPGDLLLIFPEIHGVLRASQIGVVAFSTFQLCPQLMAGLLTLAERHQLRQSLSELSPATRLWPANHPHAQRFLELGRASFQEGSLAQRGWLVDFAAMILTAEILRTPRPIVCRSPAGSRFRDLIDRMTDSELAGYQASELATLCGCSVRHLSRLFRQHFGATVRVSRRNGRLVLESAAASSRCLVCPSTAARPESAGLEGSQRQAASRADSSGAPASQERNPAAIAPSLGDLTLLKNESSGRSVSNLKS